MSDVFDGDFAYLEKENERLLVENQRIREAGSACVAAYDEVRELVPLALYRPIENLREALAGGAE